MQGRAEVTIPKVSGKGVCAHTILSRSPSCLPFYLEFQLSKKEKLEQTGPTPQALLPPCSHTPV